MVAQVEFEVGSEWVRGVTLPGMFSVTEVATPDRSTSVADAAKMQAEIDARWRDISFWQPVHTEGLLAAPLGFSKSKLVIDGREFAVNTVTAATPDEMTAFSSYFKTADSVDAFWLNTAIPGETEIIRSRPVCEGRVVRTILALITDNDQLKLFSFSAEKRPQLDETTTASPDYCGAIAFAKMDNP